MTDAGGDPGRQDASRAELAALVGSQWPQWEREGIGPGEGTILGAAAAGLVELVWRTSLLEATHVGGGLRGRGPSGGEMFAESVALHRVAKAALPRQFGLLEFQDQAARHQRPWAPAAAGLPGHGHQAARQRPLRDSLLARDRR